MYIVGHFIKNKRWAQEPKTNEGKMMEKKKGEKWQMRKKEKEKKKKEQTHTQKNKECQMKKKN